MAHMPAVVRNWGILVSPPLPPKCIATAAYAWHMPCALKQAYAHPQCDCLDFEAMHKWALKQFMRIVAHGRHLGTHLEERHLQQFIFSTPPEPPAPVQPRFCSCGQEPCPHPIHVHADMPGLVEGDEGLYTPIHRFKRSAEEVVVDEMPEQFQRALALFIAELNGCASLRKGWTLLPTA